MKWGKTIKCIAIIQKLVKMIDNFVFSKNMYLCGTLEENKNIDINFQYRQCKVWSIYEMLCSCCRRKSKPDSNTSNMVIHWIICHDSELHISRNNY